MSTSESIIGASDRERHAAVVSAMTERELELAPPSRTTALPATPARLAYGQALQHWRDGVVRTRVLSKAGVPGTRVVLDPSRPGHFARLGPNGEISLCRILQNGSLRNTPMGAQPGVDKNLVRFHPGKADALLTVSAHDGSAILWEPTRRSLPGTGEPLLSIDFLLGNPRYVVALSQSQHVSFWDCESEPPRALPFPGEQRMRRIYVSASANATFFAVTHIGARVFPCAPERRELKLGEVLPMTSGLLSQAHVHPEDNEQMMFVTQSGHISTRSIAEPSVAQQVFANDLRLISGPAYHPELKNCCAVARVDGRVVIWDNERTLRIDFAKSAAIGWQPDTIALSFVSTNKRRLAIYLRDSAEFYLYDFAGEGDKLGPFTLPSTGERVLNKCQIKTHPRNANIFAVQAACGGWFVGKVSPTRTIYFYPLPDSATDIIDVYFSKNQHDHLTGIAADGRVLLWDFSAAGTEHYSSPW